MYFSGYPDPENFSWTEYLEATQTSAVPAKVFKMVSLYPYTFSTLNNVHVESCLYSAVLSYSSISFFKLKCYFHDQSALLLFKNAREATHLLLFLCINIGDNSPA